MSTLWLNMSYRVARVFAGLADLFPKMKAVRNEAGRQPLRWPAEPRTSRRTAFRHARSASIPDGCHFNGGRSILPAFGRADRSHLHQSFMNLICSILVFPGQADDVKHQEVGLSRMFLKFLKDESAATAIEYGLIAAGISLAIIAVVNGLGTTLNAKFTSINASLK